MVFLGHVIDTDGISTVPDKVQRIPEWPSPVDLHQLPSFIGLTSYYRRFVEGYAEVVLSLHQKLTRGLALPMSLT